MPPYSWNTDKVGINYQSINKIKTKKDIMFMFAVSYTVSVNVEGQWFSLGTPVPSTNKTDHHNIG
jgi:hypothetical protein